MSAMGHWGPILPGALWLAVAACAGPVGTTTAHSIIAVEGDGPFEKGNDGVVEYSSAHIGPVESELVVQPSSHSTQGNPKTIEGVRRILRLHAGAP
jgi:hypothetical protein